MQEDSGDNGIDFKETAIEPVCRRIVFVIIDLKKDSPCFRIMIYIIIVIVIISHPTLLSRLSSITHFSNNKNVLAKNKMIFFFFFILVCIQSQYKICIHINIVLKINT